MTAKKVVQGAKVRLLKNVFTTLIGLVIWGYTLYLVKVGMDAGQSITEVASALWPYAGLGTMFLRSKDSLIGLPAMDR
jgi:hypothetical protein